MMFMTFSGYRYNEKLSRLFHAWIDCFTFLKQGAVNVCFPECLFFIYSNVVHVIYITAVSFILLQAIYTIADVPVCTSLFHLLFYDTYIRWHVRCWLSHDTWPMMLVIFVFSCHWWIRFRLCHLYYQRTWIIFETPTFLVGIWHIPWKKTDKTWSTIFLHKESQYI